MKTTTENMSEAVPAALTVETLREAIEYCKSAMKAERPISEAWWNAYQSLEAEAYSKGFDKAISRLQKGVKNVRG